MKGKMPLMAILLVQLAVSIAAASVSISASYYNNGEVLSSQSSIDNAVYKEYVQLEPSDLTWANSGESTPSDENRISMAVSYSDASGGQSVGSSIETFSGSSTTGTTLKKSFDEQVTNSDTLRQSSTYSTNNGEIIADFRSGNEQVSQITFANGASYQGVASMASDSIKYRGNGKANEDADQSSLAQLLRATDGDRWTDIALFQEGENLDYLWKTTGEMSPSRSYMETQIYTWTEDGKAYPDMLGTDSNQRKFHLPPGYMEIIEDKFTNHDGSGSQPDAPTDPFGDNSLDEYDDIKDAILDGNIVGPKDNTIQTPTDDRDIVMPRSAPRDIWQELYGTREYEVCFDGMFNYRMGMRFIF
jgi:hypothetical protein